MGGIEHVAGSISVVLHERLPWQRKTQRENLALLVATMLSERSANLMSLAAALPPSSRTGSTCATSGSCACWRTR